MSGWPGLWHSKVNTDESDVFGNTNGALYLTGDRSDEWLWLETDGHETLTECRR